MHRFPRAMTSLGVAVLLTAGASAPRAQQPAAQEGEAAPREQTIEEITVTARKREELVQQTPISITAITPSELQNQSIQDLSDLQWQTPNLFLAPVPVSSNAASITMRGHSQEDFIITVDPSVGIYVDGVYVARAVGALLNIVDAQRVEILRGPQGTLYGRNTIGGAINLVSKKPDGSFGGHARATAGSEGRLDFNTALSFPILGEDLSARLTFQSTRRDSYFHNQLPGGDDYQDDGTIAWRAQLRWTPLDTVDVLLSHDRTRQRRQLWPGLLSSINEFGLDVEPVEFTPIPGLPLTLGLPQCLANVGTLFLSGQPLPGFGDLFSCLINGSANISNEPIPFLGGATSREAIGLLFDGLALGPNDVMPAGAWPQFIEDGDDPQRGFLDARTRDELDVWGYSGTVTVDFGDVTLSSITAYRELDRLSAGDGDGTPFVIFGGSGGPEDDQREVSQELRLNGLAFEERLDWIAGLYYFWENGNDTTSPSFQCGTAACVFGLTAPPMGAKPTNTEATNIAYAAFTHATYQLTEELGFSAGVRLTKERKEMRRQWFDADCLFEGAPISPDNPDPAKSINRFGVSRCEFVAGERFSAWSYSAGLDYQVNPDLMLYAKASRGYKSGGFNGRAITSMGSINEFAPFDEEVVAVYEVGLKSDWFERRLRANAAAFYTAFRDFQQSKIVPTPDGQIRTAVVNAGRAYISGGELELVARPIPSFTLSGSLGLAYGRYKKFQDRDKCNALGLPLSCKEGDLSFLDFRASPELTVGISARYEVDTTWGTLGIQGDYSWTGQQYPSVENNESIKQEEFGLFNARISLYDEARGIEYAVFGRNLADRKYRLTGIDLSTTLGFTNSYWAPPRILGVEVSWHFGAE